MTNPDATSRERGRKHPAWRWWVMGGLALVILLAVGRLVFFDVAKQDNRDIFKPPPWDGKPRFVETTYPTFGPPPNASLWQRMMTRYLDFQMRHGKKYPLRSSFGTTAVQLCSIHGLLNQCMEVSGTHYLIANEAAAGSVGFGHTNVLNGAQWVAAFEAALQTNTPEWFDPSTKKFRKENLLLIREKSGVVKVVPPSKLADYQQAGLVDRSYRTNTMPAPSPPNK